MFWRSVVGKLYLTILFLVSFVLFVLTILLWQFFETFHINQAEDSLRKKAQKTVNIIQQYNEAFAYPIIWELIDESNYLLIIDDGKIMHSPNTFTEFQLTYDYIEEDAELMSVLTKGEQVKKVKILPAEDDGKYSTINILIVGSPIQTDEAISGGVFIYQSLDEVVETSRHSLNIILLSAAIAIILTTVFAFFLSTRITAPLRKMREAASEIAKGNFDNKVPILTHDEIGELALAFNRMGRQLEYHITALNQEKEQLSGILSSMADGVITMNRRGNIIVTNPPATRFLRAYQFEHGIPESTNPVLPNELMELLNQVISLEKQLDIELTVQGRSWGILMTPLYNKHSIRGAVAVLRDITEERRLDKLRSDFIANVSHDLRTPISMLQGYSEAIVDDIASSDEEKREIAQIIYDESKRMGRLVNELLDLARMEAGHILLHFEEINVVEFVQRIVRKFQGISKEKQIQLKVTIGNNVDKKTFDKDRMEQVLTNLIDNALRHTHAGGTVEVIVTNTEEGLQFDVKDTGIGIPQEDLPFVFERFYKADKARTRGRSGTGLGLAIVKNIVQAHDGQISVHSKLNEGTTFTFILP